MTNAISKRQKPSRYTDQEIDQSLFALALASGNSRRASAMLKERGQKVPHTTLDTWKHRTHPERYERIQADTLPKVRARLADEMEALAQDQIDLEAEITKRLRERLGEIPDRDLSGSLRNVAVAKGINMDKTAPIRGEPTQIIGSPVERAEDALAALRRHGLLVEAEAVEVEGSEDS